MSKRFTPFELEAILRAQDCSCFDDKRERADRCTRKIIRCSERLSWMQNNDETFRRVWEIDTVPEGTLPS